VHQCTSRGRGTSRGRHTAGGALVGAGTGAGGALVGARTELAANVMMRTKVEVVLNQTLGLGVQLVL